MRRMVLLFALLVALGPVHAIGSQPLPAAPAPDEFFQYYGYRQGAPLRVRRRLIRELPCGKLYRVRYISEDRLVSALFLTPEGGGPFPVVVLNHWLGGTMEQAMAMAGPKLASMGLTVLAPENPHQGSRREYVFDEIIMGAPEQVVQNIRDAVVDLRRAADFLRSQPETCDAPIGYAGISMGAILGFMTVAADDRYAAFASMVGGGNLIEALDAGIGGADLGRSLREGALADPGLASRIALSDPLSAASLISNRPVAMFNALRDATIPKSCATALYDALECPKSIQWYDAGHELNEQAFADAAGWIRDRLYEKLGTGLKGGQD